MFTLVDYHLTMLFEGGAYFSYMNPAFSSTVNANISLYQANIIHRVGSHRLQYCNERSDLSGRNLFQSSRHTPITLTTHKETTMAITKETQIGKIEVVGKYKSVQVRTDTVVIEDERRINKKVS